MNEREIVLQAENLTKLYGKGETQVAAVQGVSFNILKGEFTAITGASGSGKSTLLHMLGGVEKPTAGKITVAGQDLAALSPNASAVFRRRNIGIVYQSYNLIPVLTVKENILLPLQLDHRKEDKAFFTHLVEKLGLAEKLNALPNQLSGGQQQRVSIGRALVTRPAVLLADEPTGNLDSVNSAEIMALFKSFNEEDGQTLMLITHAPAIAAMAQRALHMQDGTLAESGVPRP